VLKARRRHFLDQYSIAEWSAELAVASFNGQLMLQALGLGGWSFDGIDRLTILGQAVIPWNQQEGNRQPHRPLA
jgi:hypothetical protein